MKNQPVSQADRPLAPRAGKEILSIQLRPDGLSFAYAEENEVKSGTIRLPAENPEAGFDSIFSSGQWPGKSFSEVSVCVPSDCAVLIPEELNLPEKYSSIVAALGYAEDPGARLLPLSCPGGLVLLHAVCNRVITPLSDKYGDNISFLHPLYISLCQPEDKNTTLYIDCAGGYGNFTLKAGGDLLFADVFPLKNEASLLLAVNRIIVANKVGALQIICSGDGCESNHTVFSRHFRNVSVHPQGESRNLLFRWACG